ncbi:hypothetical protein PW035_12715 [Nonomuraea angiospora]|nr:hypothetical protein [Nonomuraea angiospora]
MVAAAALIVQQNPSSQYETVFPSGTRLSRSRTSKTNPRSIGSRTGRSAAFCASRTPRGCGRYEWASEDGLFFVLRRTGNRYEETGRGLYRQTLDIYIVLAEAHHAEHLRRGARTEPDTFLIRRGLR